MDSRVKHGNDTFFSGLEGGTPLSHNFIDSNGIKASYGPFFIHVILLIQFFLKSLKNET